MKLAIFDFDGTLFPQDTIPFLMKQWKKQKYPLGKLLSVSLTLSRLGLQYKLGLYQKSRREQIKMDAMQKATFLFAGMSEEQLKTFFYQSTKVLIPRLNGHVVSEVKKAKATGYHTVLLSGCYEMILKYVAGSLGIDAVIGTKLRFANGLLDLSEPMDIISGVKKLPKLKEYLDGRPVDWAASCAYADSYSDLPLMEQVGQPVAVSPDAEFEQVAKRRSWRIINTSK